MSTTPSVGEGVIQAGVMARARVPVTEVGSIEHGKWFVDRDVDHRRRRAARVVGIHGVGGPREVLVRRTTDASGGPIDVESGGRAGTISQLVMTPVTLNVMSVMATSSVPVVFSRLGMMDATGSLMVRLMLIEWAPPLLFAYTV